MLGHLPLILGFTAFLALNLYLWSLPISHESLFVITAPLGILYFVAFMWYVMRGTF
jgi:hypothetical protein